MNIEKAIKEIKSYLEEAEEMAKNSACGYDEVWYNGECNAFEIVLEILAKTSL